MSKEDAKRIGPTKIGPLGLRMDLTDIRERRFGSYRAVAQAANEAGHSLSPESVRRLEHGQLPSYRVAGAIAELYGLDLAEIVPPGTRTAIRRSR